MPIVFKLVGYTPEKRYYEIKDTFNGPLTLKLIHELYIFWGLCQEEIDKIKFITDSEQIKDIDKEYPVSEEKDRIIFVFVSEPNIRLKLQTIFMREGHEILPENVFQSNQEVANQTTKEQQVVSQTNQVNQKPIQETKPIIPDSSITKPITQNQPDVIPTLTPEIIDSMNVKSVSLFSDPDFKNLISVYIKRPELFNTLAQYVQNGNVIDELLKPAKKMEDLTDDELTYYKSLADKINHLELGVTQDIIINKLIRFSGHLNLTVRSILCEYNIN
jgi:hypothetical protein